MLEKTIKKIFEYAFLGIAINIGLRVIRIMKRKYLQQSSFKKENRLRLLRNRKFSRDQIVEMGRKAIRCRLSNKILENPIVDEYGISHEKVGDSKEVLYENRMLKEFIQQFKRINTN